MSAGARIVASLASEEHAESVAAFYREVWDPSATTETVIASMRASAAANVAAPGEPLPTALVLQGSRVIGYCSSIAQRLWDGKTERPAYWVKGLMVLPEFRNGPIGFLAVKELTRHLPCATILTVAPGAKRLFGALGYTDLGAITNWVKPLRPGVMANRLDLNALGLGNLPNWVGSGVRIARKTGIASVGASVAGVVMDAAAAATRMRSRRFATALETPDQRELDALWASARTGIEASPVRDATYLINRFGASAPEGEFYTFVTARQRGRLAAIAVVRKPKETSDPRLGGIRVATVSDALFHPTETNAGLATLGAIARIARAEKADALVCMSSHPLLTGLLRRQGYLRLRGNVHFFLRDVTGAGAWPPDRASWWLGRGDGESDATF